MKQIKSFGDVRTLAFCTFCGDATNTRDHCPSKILLDYPLPDNLPVVLACSKCNNSFSLDEEYLACLISCVVAGTTNPDEMARDKIRRILQDKPALRSRIERARSNTKGRIEFKFERERVESVLIKLARGHALYELHESCLTPPDNLFYSPLTLMTDEIRWEFESPANASAWPEVGSRAMQRLMTEDDLTNEGWIEVQPNRYRFHASIVGSVDIRIVIHEYLACQVQWS